MKLPPAAFLVGSVTAKVLDDADCPVLTGVHLPQTPNLEPILFRSTDCGSLTLIHAILPIYVAELNHYDPGLSMMLHSEAKHKAPELQNGAGQMLR